ncbi:sel1 repeat family protein [Pseudomonas sp. Fl5BN2]|uniref:sel1 repeat family protein n=1 Tax=Pseudomonas sp. Fl5BN2 TaxID=2697652 RepID=UPI001376919E|nr:sel1 repeat family protein [Pseudomonas sp. Fl5BN2]NBF04941.1 sel1 repeat family protein [Pseudomonas sp. Fl5BN2]
MRSLSRLCLVLALMLAAFQVNAGEDRQALVARLAAKVQAEKAWQAQAQQCPTAVMPQRAKIQTTQANRCQNAAQLDSCMSRCEAGNGNDCYWLGTTLQQAAGPAATYEPLYQRACSLGLVSGCTNHAAGLLKAQPDSEATRQCAVQSFAQACDLDDPWACTMYGFHLSRGIGVQADVKQALKVLEKSCKFGIDDPACSGARQLQEDIRAAIKAAQS